MIQQIPCGVPIQVGIENTPTLLDVHQVVEGLIKSPHQVNHYLTRYISIRPRGSGLARKLLGRARLEIGDAKGAADVLGPLVREQPDDVEALVLLGDAWLQARIYLQAASVFERAIELAANDPKVLTRLALDRLDPYWPLAVMPENVTGWLRRGIVDGELSLGRFQIHGDLDDWPFRNGEGRFEAVAWIKDPVPVVS